MSDQTTLLTENANKKAKTNEVVLRVENLTKRYKERLAVNNLNLAVRRGEIFGFLGPNGAGKTTTIRMLFGLITPTSGRVEILGKDVIRDRASILPRVGALIETPALYLFLSGRDNLYAIASTLGGVPESRINDVLHIVGLGARQRDRVKTYSLGMKQRLAVAIALLQDPDVLILDEPANGLDPAGIVEMRDMMHQLAAQGKTVLISSHLLSEVQLICTRIAIINQGKLITETSIEELLTGRGEYEVHLDQADEALPLIKQQSWGKDARLNADGRLITMAPEGKGRNLNQFLAESGFIADGISQATQDLEEVFLQLTNGVTGE